MGRPRSKPHERLIGVRRRKLPNWTARCRSLAFRRFGIPHLYEFIYPHSVYAVVMLIFSSLASRGYENFATIGPSRGAAACRKLHVSLVIRSPRRRARARAAAQDSSNRASRSSSGTTTTADTTRAWTT